MNLNSRCLILAAVAPLAACAGPGSARLDPAARERLASETLADWAAPSAYAGQRMIEAYGIPDEVAPDSLTWRGRGGWKRTTVRDQAPLYAPDPPPVVEQTMAWELTPEQAALIRAFDGKLATDLERAEVTSMASKEAYNRLNLNLAHDVAFGLLTPEDARAQRERVLALEASGKTSPYTEGLLFRYGARRAP